MSLEAELHAYLGPTDSKKPSAVMGNTTGMLFKAIPQGQKIAVAHSIASS